MRPIDADALIKWINDSRCADCPDKKEDRCAACQWDDVIMSVETAPTVATDTNVLGGCISVKDRLPEVNFTKAVAEREAGYPHLEIDYAQDAIHGIVVNWVCPYIGYGQLHVWAGEDEKFHADTESMSDEFVLAVFRELVKQMVREG